MTHHALSWEATIRSFSQEGIPTFVENEDALQCSNHAGSEPCSEPPGNESSVLSKRLVVILFSITQKMVHNNVSNVSQINSVKTLKINQAYLKDQIIIVFTSVETPAGIY